MKIEIKHRYSGKILFSVEATSLKIALEIAIGKNANLSYANLRYADLRSANLSSANLSSADLRSADLSSANLRYANLSYANLRYADLSYANLRYADLSYADLRYANLRYANLSSADLRSADLSSADLSYADLSYANLRYANLRYADLSYANLRYADLSYADLSYADLSYADLSYADLRSAGGINKYACTPLLILKEQTGKIRAYKLVNSNNEGPYNGGIKYEIGKTVSAKADTDETVQCSNGISLATLDWCIQNRQKGCKIFVCEFTQKDLVAIPIATDGKFRVSKCKVIKEVNLKEIGLEKKLKR